MKQKIIIQDKDKEELERCYVRERDLKDKAIEKGNVLEKRVLEMQAELIIHRSRTDKYDWEKKSLERKLKDTDYRF